MAKPGGKARGKNKPPPGPQPKAEDDDSSSNELSLKLRRGSSDSRDSFYMDFDQGIDSDIEQVSSTATAATVTGGLIGATTAGLVVVVGAELEAAVVQASTSSPTRVPSRPTSSAIKPSWSGTAGESLLLSSPTGPGVVLVSTELSPTRPHGPHSPAGSQPGGGSGAQTRTHSRAHSGAPSGHGVPCSSEPGSSTQMVLPRPTSNLGLRVVPGLLPPVPYQSGHSPGHTPGHPLYPHHHPECRISRSAQSLPVSQVQVATPRHRGTGGQGAFDALTTTLSALYGKLLVVMGIAFPMAEVISTYIPPSFYEGFYLYLYFGSMLFLLCMYATALRTRPAGSKPSKASNTQKRPRSSSSSDSGGSQPPHSDTEGGSSGSSSSGSSSPAEGTVPATSGSKRSARVSPPPLELPSAASARQAHYGSFYLRMGAVAFGIGSMIYSGLEFGQYFELERNTKCHNVLLALTPATRMAFIFIQMYFIFLNNEVRVYRSRLVARFGLMHMIGTNLSVWLNVLIQETKHEILLFYNPQNDTLALHGAHPKQHHAGHHGISTHHSHHHRVARGLKGPHHIYECRRTNIMGSLVQDASPFLFPCTIEYSLICAAILYVMWKNIGPSPRGGETSEPPKQQHQVTLSHTGSVKRSPHHYSVDCARAHKGLFVGILALVLTIISLILFFVLISRPELVALAVFEVNVCELALYAASTIATLLSMLQVRELRYDGSRNLELDNILLIAAQTGMFIYSTFTIIGGHFTIEKNTALVLITALASLVQTTCQTIFILDASRRSCSTARQIRRKPGRQLVTFLLVANLAMWAVNTLEKSRAESHPIQLHFYGLWAWTIITHVSMPLAIFYRFHSTVCLCEIWKRAYKMKPTYM